MKKKKKKKDKINNSKIIISVVSIILIILIIFFLTYYFPSADKKGINEYYNNDNIIVGGIILVEAIKNENVSLCESTKVLPISNASEEIEISLDSSVSEMSINEVIDACKQEYYLYQTLLKGVNYCENMNNQDMQKFCFMLFNSENKCYELSDRIQATRCEYLFKESDVDCTDLSDDVASEDVETGLKHFCENTIPLINAIKKRDISICDKIKDETYLYICNELLTIT